MSRLFRRFRKENSTEQESDGGKSSGKEMNAAPNEQPAAAAQPTPTQPTVVHTQPTVEPPPGKGTVQAQAEIARQPSDMDERDEEDSEEGDEVGTGIASPEKPYDPSEFEHLEVGEEVKRIFDLITKFSPPDIDLDTNFKPFIPDYIPAVGDIDAFIKVPRPDDTEDKLGLVVLDEPASKQSDATVLGLQLRAMTKEAIPKGTVVKKVERADKNEKEVEHWIKSISELHRTKPATSVHYNKPMPDIETLMQEWPPEFEELLKRVDLPGAEMDMSLEQYVDLICGILDIPVYKSRVQSLHVLFTLYSEFKNSQHFQQMGAEEDLEPQEMVDDDNRLEL